MTAPAEREFAVLDRGYVRDRIILAIFRNGLRKLTDPETGVAFSEDTIQRATQPGSRWFTAADGIDLMGQRIQRRAIYLVDQLRMERASTAYLEGYHAKLWDESRLEATGGSGLVTVLGVAGTIVVGSSTIPDPAAYWARDGAGNKYQVLVTTVIGVGGTASVSMKSIDTGEATNPEDGATLTWITKDPNMSPSCTVDGDFTGGTNRETDSEYADRMMDNRRRKQGSGNDAQMRAWTRRASNSIEEAFIYPCALHAGSTMIAITQKRAGVKGPTARIPNSTVLAEATAYMVPPASPVVPARPFLLLTPVTAQGSNLVFKLGLNKGTEAGWSDVYPFPSYHATTPYISTVTTQTLIRITCSGDATLPGQASGATLTGDNAPHMMVWNAAASEFEELNIASVEDLTGNVYEVTLNSPPSFTMALSDIVSPAISRHPLISEALTSYFDSLGPGDLFDVTTDVRGARCKRFPRNNEEYPARAGDAAAIRVIEALGGSSADADLVSISSTVPGYPGDIQDGPKMLTLGTVGVYEL